MKRRILTISLIVASLVLLVSVGFAGWVITQNTSANAEDGNFTAYTVEKNDLTVNNFAANQDIVFGKPSGDPIDGAWLTADSSVLEENLTAQFTIQWSNDVPNTEEGKVTFSLSDEYYRTGTDPVTKNAKLIGGPVYAVVTTNAGATISGNVLTLKGYTKDTSITISVTYSWGTSFGNTNAYTFFNGQEKNAAPQSGEQYNSESKYVELAENALSALYTLVNNDTVATTDDLHFRVKVTKTN